MNNKAVFDELVVQCTTELFQGRSVELSRGPDLDTAIEFAGVIGFASDEVRGMLGLGMSDVTLAHLAAKDAGAAVNGEDWLGESVNQLLGRLKNKLLGYDVIVSLALPTVLRGIQLKFFSTRPSGLWTYSFASEAGPVCAWLDVRYEATFVLTPTSDPEMLGAPEGEMVLF
jgi:hypothetical protein